MSTLPQVGAAEVLERVTPERARQAIEQALLSGFDPAADPERVNVDAGAGHLLLMPSTLGDLVGIKVASVSPGNPAWGLPRIQATYVLMDAATLTPRAILDGSSITELRTPATSAVAIDHLARGDAATLVVIGAGPQAIGHSIAVAGIRELSHVSIVGRRAEAVAAAVAELRTVGVPAQAGATDDIASADIVVCATSSAEPLFDGALVRDDACVVAIGSHEPDRRELDGALLGRAQVVVEERATALRECGDVVMAVDEGHLTADDLVDLAPVVRGEVPVATDRPRVFKGAGMSWQDLAVAAAAVDRSVLALSSGG